MILPYMKRTINRTISHNDSEYRAPDISYKKKSLDISEISSKRTRKCRNIPSNNDNERNVTVDDHLSLSFPLSEALT